MKLNRKPFLFSPRFLTRWRRQVRCRGQTLVEYALILAVVSLVAIGVLVNLQHDISGIYTMVNTQLILSAAGSH
jgi:Flp pilus assembly pilin Flp